MSKTVLGKIILSETFIRSAIFLLSRDCSIVKYWSLFTSTLLDSNYIVAKAVNTQAVLFIIKVLLQRQPKGSHIKNNRH